MVIRPKCVNKNHHKLKPYASACFAVVFPLSDDCNARRITVFSVTSCQRTIESSKVFEQEIQAEVIVI